MDERFLPGAFWESKSGDYWDVVAMSCNEYGLVRLYCPRWNTVNLVDPLRDPDESLPNHTYAGNIADAVEVGCRALALLPRRFGAKVAVRLPDTWYADDAPEGNRGLNWDDMVRRDYRTGELVGEAMAGLVALHSWPSPRERFAEFRAALEARAKNLPGLKAVCDLTEGGILLELESEGERHSAHTEFSCIDWDDVPSWIGRRVRWLAEKVGMKRMMRAR